MALVQSRELPDVEVFRNVEVDTWCSRLWVWHARTLDNKEQPKTGLLRSHFLPRVLRDNTGPFADRADLRAVATAAGHSEHTGSGHLS